MEKRKHLKHSLWSNIRFIFANTWRWNTKTLLLTMLRGPFIVAIPFLGIYLSWTVVSLVEAGAAFNRIAVQIIILCAAIALSMIILDYLVAQNRRIEFNNNNSFQSMIFNTMMTQDYEYNESPKGMADVLKAVEKCGNTRSGAHKAIDTISTFIGNCIGLIVYSAVIFILNPSILVVIFVTTISSYFLLKRIATWNNEHKDKWMPINHRRTYLEIISKDFAPAKDIRLYNMAGWLKGEFEAVLRQRMNWQRKEENHIFSIEMYCNVLSFIREGVAYGLLVFMMFERNMPVSDFIFYFGMICGLTAWLDSIRGNFDWFSRMYVDVNDMREFLDYENKSNQGQGAILPDRTFAIELKNVSFRFADTDKELFHDLNLTIHEGEKLAIVGTNGAGKTTLVKLLCGLYRPTGGVVLANGKPVDAYNIQDYYSLFSVVFQDITVLPMSVRQNITCKPDGADEALLSESLRLSGFNEVVDKMKFGCDTYLVRGLYPDAVNLSGGEIQKLALARALYKNGLFLILDEPTAALDPIAESEIYQHYKDISDNKTAVFISHRLASTRFCDRIILLDDGKIIEEGTHDQLMALRGKYYEFFEIQRHYYKEEAEIE